MTVNPAYAVLPVTDQDKAAIATQIIRLGVAHGHNEIFELPVFKDNKVAAQKFLMTIEGCRAAKGLTREGKKKAIDAGWRCLVAVYLPDYSWKDVTARLPDSLDYAPPPTLSSVNLSEDILWAYCNISNVLVKRQDAPHGGAWGLLKWAREHPGQFNEKILPKALPAKEAGKKKDIQGETDLERDIREIDALLEVRKDSDAEPEAEGKVTEGGTEGPVATEATDPVVP